MEIVQLMQLLFRVNFHFRPYVHKIQEKIQENSFSRLYLGRFIHFISSDSTSFKPLRSLSVPGLQMIYLFSERVNVTPKCVPENIWIIMEESFLFRTGKVSIYLTSSSNTILYKLKASQELQRKKNRRKAGLCPLWWWQSKSRGCISTNEMIENSF